ncbi:MAG: tRNA (adenosine(37)-N6)-threonylcarbamoyltransferase complex dimerization subunit type 1 TsaB [Anaerolineae bacterium]
MPYLAIDTASRWTAIALYDETQDKVLSEKGWTATLRQTVELAPAIEQMLQEAQLTSADLTALIVAIGPGSYTGLRIGLSLARGLAMVHQLPIAAIRTHDIVAARIPFHEKPLLISVEAGRKRVLIAPYAWQNNQWELAGEINNPTWSELLETIDQPVVIAGEVPDDALEMLDQHPKSITVCSQELSQRSAGTLARLGYRQIVSGKLPNQATLVPIYLRNP